MKRWGAISEEGCNWLIAPGFTTFDTNELGRRTQHFAIFVSLFTIYHNKSHELVICLLNLVHLMLMNLEGELNKLLLYSISVSSFIIYSFVWFVHLILLIFSLKWIKFVCRKAEASNTSTSWTIYFLQNIALKSRLKAKTHLLWPDDNFNRTNIQSKTVLMHCSTRLENSGDNIQTWIYLAVAMVAR